MNCSIVGDLLPLYHDEVASVESRELVEEHLKTCAECQQVLNDIHENLKTEIAPNTEEPLASGLKVLKKRMRRKTVATIAVSIVCAAAFVSALIYGVFFFERPVPVSQVTIASTQQVDSALDFLTNARGYSSFYASMRDGALYLCYYDTFWTRYISPANRSLLQFIGAPAAPSFVAAPIAPTTNLPSPPTPPPPAEAPNALLEISQATRVYYIEGSPSQLARNEAAFERAIENAVLLWEK